MARSGLNFVDSDKLEWQTFGTNPNGRVKMRLLSQDDETGAFSMVCQMPPGYIRPRAYNTASCEVFVLEGSFVQNGQEFTRHCYSYTPKELVTEAMTMNAEKGCLMLIKADGPLGLVPVKD